LEARRHWRVQVYEYTAECSKRAYTEMLALLLLLLLLLALVLALALALWRMRPQGSELLVHYTTGIPCVQSNVQRTTVQ
jgi:flagellar biogenesis protein FliO